MSKFKVGDRVKSVGGCEPYYKDGDVGTVKSTESGGAMIQFDEVRHRAGLWYASDENLASADATTLAVGAKVKVVDEDDDRYGEVGTVESNDGDDVAPWWVAFDDGDRGYFYERDLQVIDTRAVAKPAAKFKVGDRVKVVKSESFGHDVGTVGEVHYVDDVVGCSVQAKGVHYLHPDDELALDDDHTPPTPTFKAGDRIRAVAGDSGHFTAWNIGDEFVLAADEHGDLIFCDNDGDRRFFPAHEDKFVLADTPTPPPAANPLADLLAGFSAAPSTGGGITFNLTINLPPGAITELLAAAR